MVINIIFVELMAFSENSVLSCKCHDFGSLTVCRNSSMNARRNSFHFSENSTLGNPKLSKSDKAGNMRPNVFGNCYFEDSKI